LLSPQAQTKDVVDPFDGFQGAASPTDLVHDDHLPHRPRGGQKEGQADDNARCDGAQQHGEPTAKTAAPGETTGDDQYGQHPPDLQCRRQSEQQAGDDVVGRAQSVIGPERPGDHQREQQHRGGRWLQENCVLDVNGTEVWAPDPVNGSWHNVYSFLPSSRR
jgi:hypothetical protein